MVGECEFACVVLICSLSFSLDICHDVFLFLFSLVFNYSLPLDVPLLAGLGFKVLSRSANEYIINIYNLKTRRKNRKKEINK